MRTNHPDHPTHGNQAQIARENARNAAESAKEDALGDRREEDETVDRPDKLGVHHRVGEWVFSSATLFDKDTIAKERIKSITYEVDDLSGENYDFIHIRKTRNSDEWVVKHDYSVESSLNTIETPDGADLTDALRNAYGFMMLESYI